ncbi:hypothetical protein [Microbacterium sp. CIAB417]|uniref:hypothetical protein n=1 Tax=Microbacterium sp. CIAB417 TaxID=2860287 RepID=UPI001FADD67F|nr:hypothetical protein [Microbacterium sp. CIAB417]
MTSILRSVASAAALLATAVVVAGCASGPGSTGPASTSAPQTTNEPAPGGEDGFEAAWLDEGRMFAVVTWGSSTCVPVVEDVTAEGQNVRVTVTDPDPDAACTADYAPRASVGALPDGVDPAQDVELVVTYGDVTDDVDLDGDAELTGVPGSQTEYAPSAGWFDDESLVLLTWGSSSCPPVVESVEGSGVTGTVTFATDEDQVCTMDMAPRATIIAFGDDQVEDDGFQLTLVGGNLDATVAVRG